MTIPPAGTPEYKAWCTTLQLDSKDESDAQRMHVILGAASGRIVPTSRFAPIAQRREAPEPTEPVTCRSCARPYPMPVYLAEFMRLRGFPAPPCESCFGPRQIEIGARP